MNHSVQMREKKKDKEKKVLHTVIILLSMTGRKIQSKSVEEAGNEWVESAKIRSMTCRL